MRAAVLIQHGSPSEAFEIRDYPMPQRSAEQCLIEVEAFGLNFADVMARRGLYRDAPPLPAVLGYDFVGRVLEAPEGSPHKTGMRVAGMSRFGAYASHLVTRDDAIIEVDEGMEASAACALGTQYCTAYHAAMQATHLRAGERVLIHAAAGGVGTALVQLARWKDCEIIATAGSKEKIEQLKAAGVHHAINYREVNYAEQVEAKSIDVAFNSLGGKSFKKDLSLLRPTGRMLLYGAAERSGKKGGSLATIKLVWDMGILLPITLVGSSRSIQGVNMLRVADHKPEWITEALHELQSLLKAGHIAPRSGGLFPIDQLAEAHHMLESRQSTGKLAVHW